jgi:hypothetical protein
MSPSKVLKWITGGAEAFLGIPIIGGIFVISQGWTPLFVMLILHIITLLVTKKDCGVTGGSIIGIITSCVAWIPIVGMIMHALTAIVLFISALIPDSNIVKTM